MTASPRVRRLDPPGATGLAVVLPGRGYPPAAPLLEFATQACYEHGYAVRQVWWEVSGDLTEEDAEKWVCEQLESALAAEEQLPGSSGAGRMLVVGKSLGTRAAPYVAERGWPAVWLTPLLVRPELATAFAANPAPQLLVGGKADPLWDHAAAVDLTAHGCEVLSVPEADHAMLIDGDAVGSAEVQLGVSRATEAFLSGLG